jgi:hypothetical protein
MKTVELFRDFDYRPHPRKTVRFHAGTTYSRVLELAASEIERAGAGCIVSPDAAGGYLTRDASHAFRPGKHRRTKP